jgi:ABC-type phosphate transport system substrate-binding protein
MSRRLRHRLRAAALALASSLALLAPTAAGGQSLVLIVHPGRAEAIDESWVRQVYLKQRRDWDDGSPIIPVNRESGSAERAAFTQRILRLPPGRLAAYWNERYFEGVFPPITLSSDVAVRRYVAGEPNAVGYVSPEAADDSVKVALRLE